MPVLCTWLSLDRWRIGKPFGAKFQIAASAIVVPVCQLNFTLDFNDVALHSCMLLIVSEESITECPLQEHRTSRV